MKIGRFVTLMCALSLWSSVALADVLLVGNKSGHTLWLLDLYSGKRLAELPTGIGPHEVEVSPDGRLAVVSNYGERGQAGATLTVVDLASRAVINTIALDAASRPHGLAFINSQQIAVTAEGVDQVFVVDLTTGEIVQRFAVAPGLAHMVAAQADPATLWVTNLGTGTLEKLDLSSGEVHGPIVTGDGAEGVAVVAARNEVWVTNRAANTVSVIDTDSLTVVADLPSPGFPIRAAVTPDQRHVLVTNAIANQVRVFDIASREVVADVLVADPEAKYRPSLLGTTALPIGLAIEPNGQRAFVAISGGDQVAVIDTASWTVVDRWASGREPDALAVAIAAPQ